MQAREEYIACPHTPRNAASVQKSSNRSSGIYGHGGIHQRLHYPERDLESTRSESSRLRRLDDRRGYQRAGEAPLVALTYCRPGPHEMTSISSQNSRPHDPLHHRSIHMHGTSQTAASSWDQLSQPSVLVSILVALLTCAIKFAQHRAAARGRPLPPIRDIFWDGFVFVIPASFLYAIDRWVNPPLFPTPMLPPKPATHADKSDVMRRILRVDQPGGIVASVSQAGKRAYTSTLSSLKGDMSQPAGLVNWDNSCFQNSTLQGLASLENLPRYLAGLSAGRDLLDDATSTTAASLRAFIADLNDVSNNGKTLRAPGILRNMSTIQQQDAQEYFSKLVDQVDKDVEKSAKAAYRSPGLEAELSKDDAAASQHSDDSGYQSLPILSKAGSELMTIRNPLEGLSAQRVACTACGYSEGFSMIPFNCLTLNFEVGVSEYDLFELLNNYVQLESISSVDCAKCTLLAYAQKLRQMAKVIPAAAERLGAVEKMLEEDEFDDESIKSLRINNANKVSSTKTKQVAVGRAPPSLVMHMNRSVFDPTTFRSYKNLAAVRFPKLLDLGPWCIGSGGVKKLSAGTEKHNAKQMPQNLDMAEDTEQWVPSATASMVAGGFRPSKVSGPIYELRAVVTHYGRHDNGHYICYRKHPRGDKNDGSFAEARKEADPPPNLVGHELSEDIAETDDSAMDEAAPGIEEPTEPGGQDAGSQWWRLSDETVTKVSEQDVLSQGGVFMLFYDCVDPNSVLTNSNGKIEPEKQSTPPLSHYAREIRRSPSWSDESVTTLCNARADQEKSMSEVSSVTMSTEGRNTPPGTRDSVASVTMVTEVSDDDDEHGKKRCGNSSVSASRASSVTITGDEDFVP